MNLRIAAGWLIAFALLEAVGAALTGALLIMHTIPACSTNMFDTSLVTCNGTHRPFAGIGVAVLIGGGVNAFVMYAVGALCRTVEQMRAILAGRS